MLGIGTAVALSPVARRVSRTRSLGLGTSRVIEAGSLVVGALAILAMVTLHQDFAGASGDVAASVRVSGQSLLAVHDGSLPFGPGFMAVANAVLLDSMMYESRLVPRGIPALGLIGAALSRRRSRRACADDEAEADLRRLVGEGVRHRGTSGCRRRAALKAMWRGWTPRWRRVPLPVEHAAATDGVRRLRPRRGRRGRQPGRPIFLTRGVARLEP